MLSAADRRAEERRKKILLNSENRLRKIQGLSPIRNNIKIDGDDTIKSYSKELDNEYEPEIVNIKRINSLDIPHEDLEYTAKAAVDEIPELFISLTLQQYLKFCINHRFVFYFILALCVRFMLNYSFLSLFIHHSLVIPFFVAYSIIFVTSKYLQTEHSRHLKRDFEFDRNKFNATISFILRAALTFFKFDPYTIQCIMTAFTFTQALTKDFSVYFIAFVLYDQLLFPARSY